MIIQRKAHALEIGVSGMKKIKNPLKVFLNLENFNGTQNQIHKIIVNGKEITDPNRIQNEIRDFYESLSKKDYSKLPSQINDFLHKVQLIKFNIIVIYLRIHENIPRETA